MKLQAESYCLSIFRSVWELLGLARRRIALTLTARKSCARQISVTRKRSSPKIVGSKKVYYVVVVLKCSYRKESAFLRLCIWHEKAGESQVTCSFGQPLHTRGCLGAQIVSRHLYPVRRFASCQGRCRNGKGCRFAHGTAELRWQLKFQTSLQTEPRNRPDDFYLNKYLQSFAGAERKAKAHPESTAKFRL